MSFGLRVRRVVGSLRDGQKQPCRESVGAFGSPISICCKVAAEVAGNALASKEQGGSNRFA